MDETMLDGYLLKEIVIIDHQHRPGIHVGPLRYCDTFDYYYIEMPDSGFRISFCPRHVREIHVIDNVPVILLGWID